MKITLWLFRTLVFFLVLTLSVTPAMVGVSWAQTPTPVPSAASVQEIQMVQQLARAGYLGDQKGYYLSNSSLDENDITNAILQARTAILAVPLQNPSSVQKFKVADLQTLLALTQERAADIRARKLSAWRLEHRLQTMIDLLSATPTVAPAATTAASVPTATIVPLTPTVVPVGGPSLDSFNHLKASFETLNSQFLSLQDAYQKQGEELQTLQNDDLNSKIFNAGNQGQLKLIKKLLDRIQNDLAQSQEHMSQLDQQVSQKMEDDTQLQQQVSVLNKDMEDNTEDISVLKEQVVGLQLTTNQPKSPLDDFFESKWLPGGALLVGLVALTVSLVRK